MRCGGCGSFAFFRSHGTAAHMSLRAMLVLLPHFLLFSNCFFKAGLLLSSLPRKLTHFSSSANSSFRGTTGDVGAAAAAIINARVRRGGEGGRREAVAGVRLAVIWGVVVAWLSRLRRGERAEAGKGAGVAVRASAAVGVCLRLYLGGSTACSGTKRPRSAADAESTQRVCCSVSMCAARSRSC